MYGQRKTGCEANQGIWAEAISPFSYIWNRLYSNACQREGEAPYEALSGIKPDLVHIKEFGSRDFDRIPKQSCREKFGKQARLGSMVGYASGNAYKVYVPETKRIIVIKYLQMVKSQAERRLN